MSAIKKIDELVQAAQTILVLQPDNPDGDSMGSALGLEEILGDLGKTVVMYSRKAPANYLQTLEGWDRVTQSFPKAFDLTILVDTGSPTLLVGTLEHHRNELGAKPLVIIDHHPSRTDMGIISTLLIDENAAATGQQIVELATALTWPINEAAAGKLANAILSDSLNLTIPTTTYETVQALAIAVKNGANLSELNKRKRQASALTPELLTLKAKLLTQVQYEFDGRLAIAAIDPETMEKYKDEHDPCDLIIWEMQWVKGVEVAAVFKNYGTKIKTSMRAQRPIAAKLAEVFGGGGHDRAAAFRTETNNMDAAIEAFKKAFAKIDTEEADETIQ